MMLARPTLCPRPGVSCRIAPLVVLTMLLVVLTSACVGQRDPTGYGDKVRDNFVEGCMTGFTPKGETKDPDAVRHRSLCTCLYDEMSNDKTGISFDEFKGAQAKIREDPTNPANALNKLIPKFSTFQKTCKAKVNKDVAGPYVGNN